jgi:hypothetical protein
LDEDEEDNNFIAPEADEQVMWHMLMRLVRMAAHEETHWHHVTDFNADQLE